MGALQPGRWPRGASLAVVLVALSTAGCVGDFVSAAATSGMLPGAPPPPLLYVNPESASLASPGDSAQFRASWWTDGDLSPATGCTWSVSDGAVAAPAGDGIVTATGNGQAT